MKFRVKGKGQRAKVVVTLFIMIFLTHNSPLITHHSYAQDSTPSGSLLQKLNELKTEIASKAAQIKAKINKKIENRAVIGSIETISTSELSINSINAVKTIKFDEFTEFIGLSQKKIKVETLETRDNIAALGDIDDKNILVAKKVIFLENLSTTSAKLVWGKIEKNAGGMINIKTNNGQAQKIITNSQTLFFLGNNEASIQDARVEQFLIVRGTSLGDGSIRARYIYLIPSIGFNKPSKRFATGSGEINN